MSAVLAAGAHMTAMLEQSLDEVVAAEREIYEFPWTLGNFKDSLTAGYSCFELRDERRSLIGYAVMMFGPGEAHLLNFSVVRLWQRQGYGSGLVALLIGFARAHGAARMLLEVRPSNEVGQRLYARAGFKTIGRRRGYYPARNGREDALLLALDL